MWLSISDMLSIQGELRTDLIERLRTDLIPLALVSAEAGVEDKHILSLIGRLTLSKNGSIY